MSSENSEEQKLNDLLLRDDRYKREAYRFVQEALEYTRRHLGRRGHISGTELSKGVRDLALERFGMIVRCGNCGRTSGRLSLAQHTGPPALDCTQQPNP